MSTMPTPSFLQTHPESFVHLHLHTQYSLLDGAIRLPDLIKKATEYKVPALAQTDHGNMFGAIDFYTRCKNAGIRPILGSEIYFTPGSRFDRRIANRAKIVGSQDENESKHQIHHLILLCKNKEGYENLCQLLSLAYLEGFYYKPRADLELLKKFSKGLIVTTACLKGEVGYNFFSGQDQRAIEAALRLRDIFQEDFYLEIQENGIPEQKHVNKCLIELSRKEGIPLVATNDCHYLTREDASAQEVLLCIQTGKTFSDQQRMRLSTDEFYFKSPEEMRESFSYIKEACDNTLKIADKCQLELSFKDEKGRQIYHLPDFPIQTEESLHDFFKRESFEGLERRFEGPHFQKKRKLSTWSQQEFVYRERLKEEIEMISQMGFAGYFLIVSDFIRWAKNRGIPVGPGRGSGAGSLVAYALEITNIDPIPFNLLFERFINPERVSMPDFDIDFCQTRRQEVIEYVTRKYGKERVGQIITFGKLQARAVIRDVARVYDLPYAQSDMLAKLVPEELGITLEKALEVEPKFKELQESDPKIAQILSISQRLEGLYRHASIHAAGVIITNRPLVSYCPLFKGKEGEQVVQFDKDFCEKIGLIKFDFLGLKTLTVIQQATSFIEKNHKIKFDIEAIDLEDRAVYDFIAQGKTIGVFQLESSGMIDLCKRVKPDCLEDITAINALYRPGPLESGMVDDFIEIKHGRRPLKFLFEELAPILKETYGVIAYQEQVMNIARVIAGYSLGQADMLRRAMGKKKPEEMALHRVTFLEGAFKKGFEETTAGELFDLMANFAAYGFNKSHAVAYALIAYQTAYLKYYYPCEFFAALLTSELGNTEKITVYIKDAKSFGIEVLPPDINESLWPFNVLEKNIRFGMGAVKNVGQAAVEEIVRVRTTQGPFKGILDFCLKMPRHSLNKRVLESLVKVGCFDSCETMNRKMIFHHLEDLVKYAHQRQEEKESGQLGLFDLLNKQENISPDHSFLSSLSFVENFQEKELLEYEFELMGMYVSGHPLDQYKSFLEKLSSCPIAEVQELKGQDKREIVLCGKIEKIKAIMTKKGDKMCFASLMDLSGSLECLIFPRVLLESESLLMGDQPLMIAGTVNLQESPRKLIASKILSLKQAAENTITGVCVELPLENVSEKKIEKLKTILLDYKGTLPVELRLLHTKGKATMNLGQRFLVDVNPKLALKVNELFEKNCLQFLTER